MAFAGIGDRLAAEEADALTLTVGGRFGAGLETGPGNLVLRAAALLRPSGRGAALRLDKALPVAAGIGGGSADAAAALRLLGRLWSVPVPAPEAVLPLGADVPVCLAGRPSRMRGIGERLEPMALPPAWLTLVNPGRPVATGEVFGRLARRENPPLPAPPAHFADTAALAAWLAMTRNDLEAPAGEAEPLVASALSALAAQPGCLLARMSGSGATCFGLFASPARAEAAMAALARAESGWWVRAAPLLD